MDCEEFILVLQFGDEFSKCLLAHYDASGRLCVLDGQMEKSSGIKNTLPVDVKAAGQMLKKLLGKIEIKHNLDIQTLYCQVGSECLHIHPVKDIAPYRKVMEQSGEGSNASALPTGECPQHEEIVDVFDSPLPDKRCVLTINSNHRELIQKTLLEANCFLERFIALPKLAPPLYQESGLMLYLDIHTEGSSFFAKEMDQLLIYNRLDFSLRSLADFIIDKFSINESLAREIIELEMRPTTEISMNWEKNVDMQIFLSHHLTEIKDTFADWLERLAFQVQHALDTSDLGEGRNPEQMIILGGAGPLYTKYTFLKDILPMNVIPYTPARVMGNPEDKSWMAYDALLGTHSIALEKRTKLRQLQKHKSKTQQLKEWCTRRIIGA